MREHYRRVESWARSLSRGGFAAAVAVATGVAVAVVGGLLSMVDPLIQGETMAVATFVVYYAMDPRRDGDRGGR